jgi:hypothetical protein
MRRNPHAEPRCEPGEAFDNGHRREPRPLG